MEWSYQAGRGRGREQVELVWSLLDVADFLGSLRQGFGEEEWHEALQLMARFAVCQDVFLKVLSFQATRS